MMMIINSYIVKIFAYQIEPGSQTEQAPPSAVLQLGPEDMHGFRFLTISVAPRPVLPSFTLHSNSVIAIMSKYIIYLDKLPAFLPIFLLVHILTYDTRRLQNRYPNGLCLILDIGDENSSDDPDPTRVQVQYLYPY